VLASWEWIVGAGLVGGFVFAAAGAVTLRNT
jgi:hypothetical protein